MSRALDIAVAGAGPAGLACAAFLRRDGHRVVVVERFSAPKPIGSGLMLQQTGLAALRALGLEAEIRRHGAVVEQLIGRTAGAGRLVLDVRFAALRRDAAALAVHRSALFGVLFEAAKGAGADFETNVCVTGCERGADGRLSLVGEDGRRLGLFDLVVDALGARSPLDPHYGPVRRRPLRFGALWATLPWPGDPFRTDALEQRYRAAHTMVGVLPVGRRWGEDGDKTTFFWSLKPEQYDAWRAGGLPRWRDEVAAVWPETEPLLQTIDDPDQLVFARYGHHTVRRPHAGRMAVIGDAAHATSPQLGQGANMALLDAAALALALRRTPDVEAALSLYARLRRPHVRLYQALSWLFTPFYQSDSRILPVLRDAVLAPASRAPVAPKLLAAMVAGTFLNPLKRLEL